MVQLTSRLEAAVQLVQKIVVDSRESLTAIELLECAAGTRAAPAGGPWVSMGQRTTVGQENELALRIATNALRMAHNESETLLVELMCKQLFAKAVAALREHEQKLAAEAIKRQMFYDEVVALSHPAIHSIFVAMDQNGNGVLEQEELRHTISEFMGVKAKDFDAEAFMKFYDVHGSPDGKIDEREFRWYLADWADCFSEVEGDVPATRQALADVIAEFESIANFHI